MNIIFCVLPFYALATLGEDKGLISNSGAEEKNKTAQKFDQYQETRLSQGLELNFNLRGI